MTPKPHAALHWRVPLSAVGVEVFAQPVAALAVQAALWEGALSNSERADAQTRLDREGAERFILTRGWLRTLLAARLSLHGSRVLPSALAFRRTPGGKPILEGPGAALHFNISHGGGWVAVALSDDAAVGVDVEGPRLIDDPIRIARRWFPQDEIDVLEAATSQSARQQFFLELWSMKEAVSKAHGRGMSLGLGARVLSAHQAFEADPTSPSFASVTCGDGTFYLARTLSLPGNIGHICVAARVP